MKLITGIAIMRCQLSESACPSEKWKKNAGDNPEFKKFCIDMEETVVGFMDCDGCKQNKNKAKGAKERIKILIEHGIDNIFLTRCMCRNSEINL